MKLGTVFLSAFLSGFFATLLASPLAWADRPALVERAPFPWRLVGRRDIRPVSDAKVAAQLRLEMMARAATSIDVVTYAQGTDEPVAMPVMTALKAAANRGVHVRFIANRFFDTILDPLSHLRRYLCDQPTRAPIDVLLVGDSTGGGPWGFGDYAHEKYVIIDGKWVFHSGRTISADALQWLDRTYLITGPLVADVLENYNRLWDFARRSFPPVSSPALQPGEKPAPFKAFAPPPELELKGQEQTELADALQSLDSDAASADVMHARLIHYDFLQQMWMHNFPATSDERVKELDDPIVGALIERVSEPGTREVLLGTMIALLRPDLKRALIAAAQRGVRVHLFVDSPDADRLETPMAVNWAISLPDLADLLAGGVTIDTFKKSDSGAYDWVYLHEKLAIIDDTVFFGSHNFNLLSSTNNDEASFEVRSPDFAAQMRESYRSEDRLAGTPLTADELKRLMRKSLPKLRFEQWLGHRVEWLF